jgi:16S rRNA (guanine527-N7)-methyltransferase
MINAKDFIRVNVSRETFSALEIYERSLVNWQKQINLVADSTLKDLWNRHFLDSYQLAEQIKLSDKTLADLGSGAGFPAMVLAIMGIANIHMIESDQRKCAFLRDVSRETFAMSPNIMKKPNIINDRVESVIIKADVIICRAFAELEKILNISSHMTHEKTEYLLLKPLDMDKELTNATKYWYFEHDVTPSISDPRGCILSLRNVHKK